MSIAESHSSAHSNLISYGLSRRGLCLLRTGMLAILIVVTAHAWASDLVGYPIGVDLEIPLMAAHRWESGAAPYLASAFHSAPGTSQPFLYPPFVLPMFSLLGKAPGEIVHYAWIGLGCVLVAWSLRRLRIPAPWWPLIVAWPPFAEPILGGNIQLAVFAAFVAVFYRPLKSGQLVQTRDIASTSAWRLVGLMSAAIGAVKVSQPQVWLYVLRYRPRAAILGASMVVLVVAATLPVTGSAVWFEWVGQLSRTQDPSWKLAGFGLPNLLGPFGTAISLVATGLVLAVGKSNAAVWVGLLATIGASSLHIFGLLFLVPAMLFVPTEIALVAAILIATYTYEGAWAAIVLLTAATLVTPRAMLRGAFPAIEAGRRPRVLDL